jgi:sensor domain CHASE-containing protein
MVMIDGRADEHRGDWQRSIILPVLLALAVMLVAAIFLDRQNQQIAENRLRTDTLHQVSVIRAKLEGHITAIFSS